MLTDGSKILNSTDDELESAMSQAFQLRLKRFGRSLLCYSPTAYPYQISDHAHTNPHGFISLSITGDACSLKCEHCLGRFLGGMQSATTPEELLRRARTAKSNGGSGVLISGGADSKGHVPLKRFSSAIRTIKSDLNMQVVVHTGLLDPDTADGLADARIDAAMLDVIADERTALEVYHLREGPKRTENTLNLLLERGIPVVPHVLVGLDYGKVGIELGALDMIARSSPAAVVIIVLNPLRHTSMEHIHPPPPLAVARVLTTARLGLKDTPLLLGCARPVGKHKIDSDCLAVRSGVNGIAYISQEGVDCARRAGLEPEFMDECCSLAYLRFVDRTVS